MQDICYFLENPENLCGLYLQALCTGLDQVLEPYRKTLLDLEREASIKFHPERVWNSHLPLGREM